jgi:dTDP-4-dehydrorhamnose 3,5-epimerase
MPFRTSEIPGLLIFEPAVHKDDRGYFFESYNEVTFSKQGIDLRFVQDNQSFSRYGVIRGLHYQVNPHAQAKLIRVLRGNILDVAVDIRKGSPTYGQSVTLELSAENKLQFFIPSGFAHGFSVLSESAEVSYKCDALYSKGCEGGIRYNDPALHIDWQIPAGSVIISPKDVALPMLADCLNNFEYHG